MQRVLSFQMARGLGESSEFVTKRMCFSFLFSVGFLCLLCGFLLGRFAAERSIEYRAEKKRLEYAGNGLESTEYLQRLLLEELEGASFDFSRETDSKGTPEKENIKMIIDIFSNLTFFHKVIEQKSYALAAVHGSREPDRYIIISVNEEGTGIALELAKLLSYIHSEHNWKPRRTLVFCIFLGVSDICLEKFPTFLQQRIVTYIAVHSNVKQGSNHLVLSGSDIIRSIALQAIKRVHNFNSQYNDLLSDLYNSTYHEMYTPRLALNIPHVTFSFATENNTYSWHWKNKTFGIILGQIVSQTIWTVSESLVLHWDTKYFNDSIYKIIESTYVTKSWEVTERLKKTVTKLISNAEGLKEKVVSAESSNLLETRILNDLLMDLDRALLCPDKNFHSKTDLAVFSTLSHESNTILVQLNEMQKCYETAIEVLQGW